DAGGFDISSTPGGEKDSDLNTTYTLTGRYYATDTLTFGGTLRHTDREADQDAFVFGALNSAGLVVDDLSRGFLTETFGSVFAEMSAFGGRLENRVELSFGNIERRGHDGLGNANADNTATRAKASYRGSLALDAQTLDAANHVLTFGAEWEQETYKGNQAFFGPGELVKRSRDQSALVMEYQGSFGNGFDVQGSLRHDFNDKFQDATTYALGASYAFATGTRVHASYGTGFQNPTLIEQFGFFANFTGNPNLQPEESEGWDIGIEQQILGGRGVIDVTYFDEELTNEITSVFNPVTGVSTPVNQPGKSDRKGVEVAADVALTDRLDLWLSYTWLDADDPNGTVEVRRPENEALLRLDYLMPNDRTSFNLEVQHVEGLYDFDFTFPSFGTTKIKLKDYTLVNLGMSHKITDNTRLNAGIRNLTDERYQELDGYAGPGRTVFVGVSGTF
ncbi:MAG: TonB-dependent receptor, partial [Roseovarius sp.]